MADTIQRVRNEIITRESGGVITVHAGQDVIERAAQGPAGRDGAFQDDTRTAGMDLSARRVVRLNASGEVVYCDSDTLADAGQAYGVTVTAALTGEDVVVRVAGLYSDSLFSLVQGPVFCGANGVIAQTPGTAFSQNIGTAISATEIMIAVQQSIIQA